MSKPFAVKLCSFLIIFCALEKCVYQKTVAHQLAVNVVTVSLYTEMNEQARCVQKFCIKDVNVYVTVQQGSNLGEDF